MIKSPEQNSIEQESKENIKHEILQEVVFPNGNKLCLERDKNLKNEEENYFCYLKDKDDNVLIDFKNLLKPGYRFSYQKNALVNFYDKTLSVGQWRDCRDILLFFHEIGHTHQEELVKKLIEIRYKISQITNDLLMVKEKLSYESDNQELWHLQEELEKEQQNLIQDKIEIEAKVERGAWAWALKTIRQFRDKQNINLLSGFKNFEEVEHYLHYALGTYEREALVESRGRLKNFFTYKKISK
jgi:hypothetical protein